MLLCLVQRREGQSKQECNLLPVPLRESIIHRTLMASWSLRVFPSACLLSNFWRITVSLVFLFKKELRSNVSFRLDKTWKVIQESDQ